ncbi:hypothetical protein BP5796_04599 [Coleophoma crateriformis]|uniref:2EXR domain-containing protein n=1 Tax=Coleophoma crateriformis TaxID=565419 RepID=A0A3D8SBH5_9HELO|nr:hypothetical protein BP5796_04599 [Coleophoma crateriformis]
MESGYPGSVIFSSDPRSRIVTRPLSLSLKDNIVEPPSKILTIFSRLPTEIRTYIWGLSLPGARLIEVYCRPRDRHGGFRLGYKWTAVKCQCLRKCHSLPAVFHVNQEARMTAQRNTDYGRCFGTWVNWAADTIFIGPRVGHLHNTQFLDAVAAAGGLERMRHIAIETDVWDQSRCAHRLEGSKFKRCSPAGLVQQLSNLRTLTMVGNCGSWDDGGDPNVEHGGTDNPEQNGREWIHDDDMDSVDYFEEAMEYDNLVYEDNAMHRKQANMEEGSETGREMASEEALADKEPKSEDSVEESTEEEWDDFSAASDSDAGHNSGMYLEHGEALRASRFYCGNLETVLPQEFKPTATDGTERRFAANGDCGFALVDFEDLIESEGRPLPFFFETEPVATLRSYFAQEFEALKDDTEQYYDNGHPDNADDEEADPWPHYKSYTPPELRLALFRRTAPSCFEADWNGLVDAYRIPTDDNYSGYDDSDGADGDGDGDEYASNAQLPGELVHV